MVRAYLRYEPRSVAGVVASPEANCVEVGEGLVAVGGLERVLLWDLRTASLRAALPPYPQPGDAESEFLPDPDLVAPKHAHVTFLARFQSRLAAGYSDGVVRVWDVVTGACVVTLNGHKGAITALCFDAEGGLLASGSHDTDVIVWDLAAETGLFRLRGHKGNITGLCFLRNRHALVSSSKDMLVKVWDLDTQHCIQTVVGHRSEVWSIAVDHDETRLITGSAAPNLRIYRITAAAAVQGANKSSGENSDESEEEVLKFFGEITRQGKERVVQLSFSSDATLFGCLGADKTLELFRVHPADEVRHRQKKRVKRTLAKKQQQQQDAAAAADAPEAEVSATLPTDEFSALPVLRASHKIRSFDLGDASRHQVVLGLHNNALELWDIPAALLQSKADKAQEASAAAKKQGAGKKAAVAVISEKAALLKEEKDSVAGAYRRVSTIELAGHRSDIRSVNFSSDDSLLMSTSSDMVKVWNFRSMQCIRTIPSGYGLCGVFVPGNRHIVIGTKEGHLELYGLSSSSCLQSIVAHSGPVWSIAIRPDLRGLVSVSADHEVKFWDFELVEDASFSKTTKRLGLTHQQTLRMSDSVLALKFSKDGKFLAVALLDNTVKVFFADTLKFFLSLYGHKLPVMSLDISSDSTMLISGSADKNVKIWGLDFGDCHKSLLAHEDSVMSVQFVPNTHYFFSCGKDKTVKYWDADKFEHIFTLDAHHAEVWTLALSSQGHFLATGSHDRSLRVWEQTDEQVFLDEEKDKQMEAIFEQSLENPLERGKADESESGSAGKRTIGTIKAGERLAEAIELAEAEKAKLAHYRAELLEAEKVISPEEHAKRTAGGKPLIAPPPPDIHLLGMSPSAYVLKTLKDIRPSELDEALLILPFSIVVTFFHYLESWAREGKEVDLVARCLFYMLRIYQAQIGVTKDLRPVLLSLQKHVRAALQTHKDVVGFNKAAMAYLRSNIELSSSASFFADAPLKLAQIRQQGTKRKHAATKKNKKRTSAADAAAAANIIE